ncbi:MAG: hypothetical protein CMJ46_12375 [Planctomyces sp.]|nr:hypothetical protein [Planctomyces sp.]
MTFAQRGKEEASDYRYFPDPDLVPVIVSDEMLNEAQASLCEFPAVRRDRFQSEYGLSLYDSTVIIEKLIPFADYFETVAKGCGDGKQAANWVTQDVTREMNDRGLTIEEFPIKAEVLAALLAKVIKGDLTIKSAREVFMDLLELPEAEITAAKIDQIIDEKGLGALQDTGQITAVIEAVVAKNEKAANDIREGKLQAAGPLIGQVMKELKGADPKTVRQMIIDHIQGN